MLSSLEKCGLKDNLCQLRLAKGKITRPRQSLVISFSSIGPYWIVLFYKTVDISLLSKDIYQAMSLYYSSKNFERYIHLIVSLVQVSHADLQQLLKIQLGAHLFLI